MTAPAQVEAHRVRVAWLLAQLDAVERELIAAGRQQVTVLDHNLRTLDPARSEFRQRNAVPEVEAQRRVLRELDELVLTASPLLTEDKAQVRLAGRLMREMAEAYAYRDLDGYAEVWSRLGA